MAENLLILRKRVYAALLVRIVLHSSIPPLHRVLEGCVATYSARISYTLHIYHSLRTLGWMNTGIDAERYLLKRSGGAA